jgi:transposase
MARFQPISGPERRRRWREDQKRAPVAAAFAPGAIAAEVARRADVYPGQLYRWRQELREAGAGFAEVVLTTTPGQSIARHAGPASPTGIRRCAECGGLRKALAASQP